MNVLIIGFPSGIQRNLSFDGEFPPISPDANGVITLTDDYGQSVSFNNSPDISFLRQDADETGRLHVAMMVRQKLNETKAMSQIQSDPRNIIMMPGGRAQ